MQSVGSTLAGISQNVLANKNVILLREMCVKILPARAFYEKFILQEAQTMVQYS